MTPLRSCRSGGYTLVELIVVLALLALLVSAAAPAFGGHLERIRMQSALDGLARDISYARMAATRAGRKAELRFFPPDGSSCISSYEVVIVGDAEQLVKRVDVTDAARGLCLRKNGTPVVSFSSRGRPNWNYSFWVRSGASVDSMTLNQLGRVYRWY